MSKSNFVKISSVILVMFAFGVLSGMFYIANVKPIVVDTTNEKEIIRNVDGLIWTKPGMPSPFPHFTVTPPVATAQTETTLPVTSSGTGSGASSGGACSHYSSDGSCLSDSVWQAIQDLKKVKPLCVYNSTLQGISSKYLGMLNDESVMNNPQVVANINNEYHAAMNDYAAANSCILGY